MATAIEAAKAQISTCDDALDRALAESVLVKLEEQPEPREDDSAAQAEAREAFYASAGILCCYQLSLSLDPGADILDSTLYGNAGRFINSSCSPNLVCKKLMGESPHEGVPSSNAYASPARPMFYASRDILKGDELTWQYNAPPPKSARSSSEEAAGLVQQRNGSHMDTEKASCYCGEKNCVGRL